MGVIDDYLAQIDSAPSSPASGGGGGSSRSAGSGYVYMGKVRVSSPRRVQVPIRAPGGRMKVDDDVTDRSRTERKTIGRINTEADNVAEIDAVRGQVFEWYGTDDFAKWGRHLLSLGLVAEEDVSNIEVLDEAWQDALEMAGRMYSSGKRITPWEAASLLASGSGAGRYGGSGGSGRRGGGGAADGPFTGRRRSSATSVDLTDPATAKALLSDTLAQKLGRAPNESELAQFTAVLNSAERANPTTTTTDTDYVEGVATSQSSTTSGGLTGAGRQQMAADEAMKKPEYGAFQAATTYYNAMVAALGSPV